MKKKYTGNDPNPVKALRRFWRKANLVNPLYVGIDPGFNGGIAFSCGKDYLVLTIPTIKVKKGKRGRSEFEEDVIVKMMKPFSNYTVNGGEPTKIAMIELLQGGGMPGGGHMAFASGKMGYACGMWPLFMKQLGFEVIKIRPNVWKKKMKMTRDKNKSLKRARKLFPKAPLLRKKDHNRAEALLLCHFLKKVHRTWTQRDRDALLA